MPLRAVDHFRQHLEQSRAIPELDSSARVEPTPVRFLEENSTHLAATLGQASLMLNSRQPRECTLALWWAWAFTPHGD